MEKEQASQCLQCGGNLSAGYLLGKHNRIRWSVSRKGMTIFHGVPLMKSVKNGGSNLNQWFYAPSISAQRCERCRLVFFEYDNEAPETATKEKSVSIVMGLSLMIIGFFLLFSMIYWGNTITSNAFLGAKLLISVLSLFIGVFGAICFKHGMGIKP